MKRKTTEPEPARSVLRSGRVTADGVGIAQDRAACAVMLVRWAGRRQRYQFPSTGSG